MSDLIFEWVYCERICFYSKQPKVKQNNAGTTKLPMLNEAVRPFSAQNQLGCRK